MIIISIGRSSVRAIGAFLVVVGSIAPCAAQSAENVAVVINDASPASQRIGEHYIRVRAIPETNVIRITASTEESIARAAYVSEIETPIANAIRRAAVHDRILYIVLTKGVPLRITGSDGQEGTVSSVDSELTLLYRRMTGRDVAIRGRVPNPYYLGAEAIGTARPFTHRAHDIYLVTRLDAFTVEEAIALIDRAQAPSRDGRFVLDQRADVSSNPVGDRWLAEAHKRLTDLGLGDRVVLESTTNPARGVDNVLGYYSWGSNDPQNRARRMEMRFVPGALAATFVSTDARTFTDPPAEWQPTSDWKDRAAHFGGSPQTLIGDLIRDGATGVAGHVAEPYLQSTIRPEVLFPAYVSGYNLAESFYMAMPDLSWQAVVIGDPLCAAFPRKLLTRAEIEEATDPDTELPALFSTRRADVARAELKAAPLAAVKALLRAEARNAHGDEKGAVEALEAAIKIDPTLTGAHLQLATRKESAGNHQAAADHYRQVLKVAPSDVIALNNLAYHLGVREKKYSEAMDLARRAVLLAPQNPSIVDTLAWIEHLSGDSTSAAKRFAVLGSGEGVTPEINLHAALVFAAVGDLKNAEIRLSRAIDGDPNLATREDAQKVRALLKLKP